MVFFEAPHRLAATLDALAQAFGAERPVAVCRELTKTYEEVVRGTAAEVLAWAQADEVRGEVTLVVQGAPERPAADPASLVDEVQRLCDGGLRLKDAVAEVAERHRVPKRELYAAALAART
jgi:16S rRNA (cytidine1402-2'-O)-methyltransferase